eukprot:tig00001071_g6801.t1
MLAPAGLGLTEADVQRIKDGILSQKTKIDTRNALGQTALHYSAINGSAALADFLLDHGADVDAETINLSTPLLFASRAGAVDVVDLLLRRKADISKRSVLGKSAIHVAIEKGHVNVLERLLQEPSADVNDEDLQGRTALHVAVEMDAPHLVETLLKKSASLASVWEDGDDELTPLDLARRRAEEGREGAAGVVRVLEEAERTRGEAARQRDAELLAERRRRRNAQREFFVASYFGTTEAMEALLAQVPCDVRNPHGNTALHECVEEGRLEAAAWLLSRGASLAAKDIKGNTALHLCAGRLDGAMLGVLLEKGSASQSDARQRNCSGETPLHAALSVRLDDPDRPGVPLGSPQPLPATAGGMRHGLPSIGNLEQLEQMQMSRVPSSLDMARLGGLRAEELEPLTPPPPAFLALQRGAGGGGERCSPGHECRGEETAAQLAAMVETVCLLLHAGADPWAKDLKGRSPVQVAVERGLLGPLAAMLGAGEPVDAARRERFEEAALLAARAGLPRPAPAPPRPAPPRPEPARARPEPTPPPRLAGRRHHRRLAPRGPRRRPRPEGTSAGEGSHSGKYRRASGAAFLPVIDEAFCTRCSLAAPAAEPAAEAPVPTGPPPPPPGPDAGGAGGPSSGSRRTTRRASISGERPLPRIYGLAPEEATEKIFVPGLSAPKPARSGSHAPGAPQLAAPAHAGPGGPPRLPRTATLPVRHVVAEGALQKPRASEGPAASTGGAEGISRTAFQSLLALWKASPPYGSPPGPAAAAFAAPSEHARPPAGNARPPPPPVPSATPPSTLSCG